MKNNGGKVFLAFTCAMVVTGCVGFEEPDTGTARPRRGFSLLNNRNDRQLMNSRDGRIPQPMTGMNNNSHQAGNGYQNSNAYQNNMAVESTNGNYIENTDIYTSEPITIDNTPIVTAPAVTNPPVTNPAVTNPPVVTPPVATPVHHKEPVIERPMIPVVKPIKYTVVRGDSLWKIGRYYGVTMNTLANFNNIPLNSRLKIGQTIMLPPGAKYNPSPKPIKRTRKAAKVTPSKPRSTQKRAYTPKGKMPIPASGKYVIKKGDSLWKIAHKFGISVREIKRLNNMKTNNIRPNKTIVLRSGVSNGAVVVEKRPNVAPITNKSNNVKKDDAKDEDIVSDVLDNDPKEEDTTDEDNSSTVAFGIYTVTDDDETLKSIAETWAVTEESLKVLNPKLDWDNLRSGMEVKYPSPK